MGNKNILFIVSDFYSGGAQRETYELDLELKKRGVELEILCLHSLNSNIYFKDHYFPEHHRIGTKIHFLQEYKFSLQSKNKLLNSILRKLFRRIIHYYDTKKISNFLKEYHEVFFMGEFVYQYLSNDLTTGTLPTINIFTMCSRFQGAYYRKFDPNNKYYFIDGFDTKEQVLFEFEGFNNYLHKFFPLSLAITQKYKMWVFNHTSTKKIGIFTRLSPDKPLDPFFYSFHILLTKIKNVELHVFGAGNPTEAGYTRYLDHLKINTNVFFRGHQQNIKESVIKEEIDLVWFQGYLNRPAGYAGLDIALTGTPQLFWDFSMGSNLDANKLDSVYPHFNDILKFTEASQLVLNSEEFALHLSNIQYNNVLESKDMSRNFEMIKDLFFNNL